MQKNPQPYIKFLCMVHMEEIKSVKISWKVKSDSDAGHNKDEWG